MTEIDALLKEDRRFPPSAEWRRTATVNDPDVYRRAAADPGGLLGRARPRAGLDPALGRACSNGSRRTRKWFVGGKMNVSVNCVDRHVRTARRNKAAIIWEGEPGDAGR